MTTAYQPPPQAFYQPGTPAITVTSVDRISQSRLADDVRQARQIADLVVVQFHWGVAGYAYPLGYMRALARCAIDAGADLIVGNHPHLLLGTEFYRGRLICYNLNHFAFDDRTPPWPGALDTLILTSTVEGGRFTRHSFAPAVIDPELRDLTLADAAHARDVASLLTELSAAFGTTFAVEGTVLVPAPPDEAPPEPGAATSYADLAPSVSEGLRMARKQSQSDLATRT